MPNSITHSNSFPLSYWSIPGLVPSTPANFTTFTYLLTNSLQESASLFTLTFFFKLNLKMSMRALPKMIVSIRILFHLVHQTTAFATATSHRYILPCLFDVRNISKQLSLWTRPINTQQLCIQPINGFVPHTIQQCTGTERVYGKQCCRLCAPQRSWSQSVPVGFISNWQRPLYRLCELTLYSNSWASLSTKYSSDAFCIGFLERYLYF